MCCACASCVRRCEQVQCDGSARGTPASPVLHGSQRRSPGAVALSQPWPLSACNTALCSPALCLCELAQPWRASALKALSCRNLVLLCFCWVVGWLGLQTPMTGVVVDAGHSGVSVVPVVEGCVLPGGTQSLPVGGAHLTALVHHPSWK